MERDASKPKCSTMMSHCGKFFQAISYCDELLFKLYRIHHSSPYLCPNLSWHPKAITEGSSIKLTNCKDKRKQRFRFSGTAAPIASRDPDLCVLYSNGPPSKGDKVKLQNCTGDASQNWSWA